MSVQEGSVTTATLPAKSNASVPIWSRSVGTMKCQLTGLVRPKTTALSTASDNSTVAVRHESTHGNIDGNRLVDTSRCEKSELSSLEQRTSGSGVVSTGLAGIGAYSSSSGSSDNDESS